MKISRRPLVSEGVTACTAAGIFHLCPARLPLCMRSVFSKVYHRYGLGLKAHKNVKIELCTI
ncbi:hypothetical protein CLOM621_08536 [Clostridium sp. M62/1]|nr:hypothetical protein CLOM621_08536 [Clostridium sp. M62/1]